MHRTWEYDVGALLRPGENSIEITFPSPTRYLREEYARSRAERLLRRHDRLPHLRKAHCMFGWDWGPRLPDAGIWRDIRLVGIETARIESVLVDRATRTAG